ncbi:glutamate receptor ionotropic, delta-1-like [Branchiostoma floridae x Branchiostoma belcheri]
MFPFAGPTDAGIGLFNACSCSSGGLRQSLLPRMVVLSLGVAVLLCCSTAISDHMVDVPLGAIFEDEKTLQEEEAFRYAVDQINADRTILPKARLVPRLVHLDKGDPLLAIRKGCNLMADGIAAIVSSTSCPTNIALQSVCNAMHVPLVFVARDNCQVTAGRKYTLSMRPEASGIDRALADVILQQRWRSMVVFYDDYYAFSRIQNVLALTRGNFMEVIVLKLPSLSNGSQVIVGLPSGQKEISDYGEKLKRVVILCTVENTIRLVKQANQMNLFTPEHHWVIANQEVSDKQLLAINASRGVLTVVRKLISFSEYTDKFMAYWRSLPANVTDGATTSPYDVKMTAAYMYDAVLHISRAVYALFLDRQWIGPNKLRCSIDVSVPWPGGPPLMETLRKVRTPGVLGKSGFDDTGYNINSQMQVLRLEKVVNKTRVEVAGMWDPVTRLNTTARTLPAGAPRVDIRNKTFRVVTLEEEPFVFKRMTPVGVRWEGFAMDMLTELSKLLGFKYKLYEVQDKKYGSPQEDGTWSGMIGDVMQGKADFALSAITITPQREQVVDFTKRYMDFAVGILLRKPVKKTDLFVFLDPFHVNVWLCTIAAFILVSAVLFLLHRIGTRKTIDDPNDGPDFNLRNTMWFVYGSFVQQGGDLTIGRMPTRILTGVWWLFTLIIISSYTANLAAFLTVTRMDSPIRSFDDLASQTEIPYGTVTDTSIAQFLASSDVETYQRLWSFMKSENNSAALVRTAQEGFQRVRKGKYAFLWDVPVIEYEALTDKNCELTTVGKSIYSKGYGIAFPSADPYRDEFTLAILQLQDSGTLDKLRHKWWPKNGKCKLDQDSASSSSSALDLDNFAGVFCVLAIGVVLACAVALLEVLWHMYRRRREKRNFPAKENGELACKGGCQSPSNVTVRKDENGEIHIIVSPTITQVQVQPNLLIPAQTPVKQSAWEPSKRSKEEYVPMKKVEFALPPEGCSKQQEYVRNVDDFTTRL